MRTTITGNILLPRFIACTTSDTRGGLNLMTEILFVPLFTVLSLFSVTELSAQAPISQGSPILHWSPNAKGSDQMVRDGQQVLILKSPSGLTVAASLNQYRWNWLNVSTAASASFTPIVTIVPNTEPNPALVACEAVLPAIKSPIIAPSSVPSIIPIGVKNIPTTIPITLPHIPCFVAPNLLAVQMGIM